MLKIPLDNDLKRERGYKDPKTKVWADGREKLCGEDWIARKIELINRSGGRCEMTKVLHLPHDRYCNGEGGEPHHIIPRWKKRDDRLAKLADLNHWCHAWLDTRKVGGRKSTAEDKL